MGLLPVVVVATTRTTKTETFSVAMNGSKTDFYLLSSILPLI